MTLAWTFSQAVIENELKPVFKGITGDYIEQLIMQMSYDKRLYAEIRWRDPLGVQRIDAEARQRKLF